jgi:hypothetical protein
VADEEKESFSKARSRLKTAMCVEDSAVFSGFFGFESSLLPSRIHACSSASNAVLWATNKVFN